MIQLILRVMSWLILPAIIASSAYAHRQWLLPSSTVLSSQNEWITVDAAVSNDLFFANYVALPAEGYRVLTPTGDSIEPTDINRGKIRTTFDVLIEEEGTYRIQSVRDLFFARWMENDEPQRWRGSEAALVASGILTKPEVSVGRNRGIVETIVTSGNPSEAVFALQGEGLEFIPLSHPNDLYAEESVRFGFAFNGEPIEDLLVMIVRGDDRFRDEPGMVELTTDAEGVVELVFDIPGRYWLNTTTRRSGGDLQGVPLDLSYSYTLTFEVLPQ